MTKEDLQHKVDSILLDVVDTYNLAIEQGGEVAYNAYAIVKGNFVCYVIGWHCECERERGLSPYFVNTKRCGAVKHFDKPDEAWKCAKQLDPYKIEEMRLITINYKTSFSTETEV